MAYRNSGSPSAKNHRVNDEEGGASRNGKAAASSSYQGGIDPAIGDGGLADLFPPLPTCEKCFVNLSVDDDYWCKTCCSTYTRINDVLPVEMLGSVFGFLLGRMFHVEHHLPISFFDTRINPMKNSEIGRLSGVCRLWRKLLCERNENFKLSFEKALNSSCIDYRRNVHIKSSELVHMRADFLAGSYSFERYPALVVIGRLFDAAKRIGFKNGSSYKKFLAIFENTNYIDRNPNPLLFALFRYISIGNKKKRTCLYFLKAMGSHMSLYPCISQLIRATSLEVKNMKQKRQFTWFIVITIASITDKSTLSALAGKRPVFKVPWPKEAAGDRKEQDAFLLGIAEGNRDLAENMRLFYDFINQIYSDPFYSGVVMEALPWVTDSMTDAVLNEYRRLRSVCERPNQTLEQEVASRSDTPLILEKLKEVPQWQKYQESQQDFFKRKDVENAIDWCIKRLMEHEWFMAAEAENIQRIQTAASASSQRPMAGSAQQQAQRRNAAASSVGANLGLQSNQPSHLGNSISVARFTRMDAIPFGGASMPSASGGGANTGTTQTSDIVPARAFGRRVPIATENGKAAAVSDQAAAVPDQAVNSGCKLCRGNYHPILVCAQCHTKLSW